MTVSQKRDYYDVLGVDRNASPDDVKRAYRKMAMRYHPDRNPDNPGAETKFKEAAEAYDILADPAKRQRYEQFGHAGVEGAGSHDFSHMRVDDIFSMFGDLLGGALGGGRRRSRGADLQATVEISLEDVANGTEQSLTFERMDFCDDCGGSGAAPGSRKQSCPTCGGYGQVEQTGGLGALFGRVITNCPSCRGRGAVVVTPCKRCKGTGRQRKERVVNLNIPAGIHDGQVVRLRGEGEPGEDGSSRGDLHCYVSVRAHPFLERHGNDLVCRVPIPFTQAALGANIEVPTLNGKANVKIPRGTQSGQVFRLSGQGLPEMRTRRRGDELVQVTVEIPRKLNREQESLLRQFSESGSKTVAPESKRFFDRFVRYLAGDDIE